MCAPDLNPEQSWQHLLLSGKAISKMRDGFIDLCRVARRPCRKRMQRLQRRRPHLKPTRSCRDWPTHFQVACCQMPSDFTYLGTIQLALSQQEVLRE